MGDIGVGIIGLGWAAGAHIETLKQVDGAAVTAACSRRELDGEKLEEEYGIPIRPYQSYEEMLTDESVDVIDICSPNPFHVDQAVAAANAGKDLILEKPIALNWEEASRLRDVIEKTGAKVCVCFEMRFSEQGQALRSMISEELIGGIHYAEVDYYHAIGPWYGQFAWNVKEESGGSSLLSAGCHAMDLLLWYVDSGVDEVFSYSTKTENEEFDAYEYNTTSVTVLEFEDGRVGKVASVLDCLQPYYLRMHLVGSEGAILDDKFHTEKVEGLNHENWSRLGVPLVDSGQVEHHPYLPQFQSFIDSLEADREMPKTNFKTALETHRVIYAADQSAAENHPVALSKFE